MNPLSKLGLGAHPSPTDARDHKDPELATAVPYPDKYITDLTTLEARMQFFIGKCVGEGTAKRMDSLYPGHDFSDDFIYRGAKTIDGNLNEGTNIRSALKYIQNNGACTKPTFRVPVTNTMTYPQYLTYQIPQVAYDEAKNYKIGQYLSIPIDVSLLKAAIYKYGILVVRFDVDEAWWTDINGASTWDASKILPLRAPKTPVSGHCVVLYGYDSTITPGKTMFYLSNSWSTQWANNGNGYFYFEDYQPTEAWAVTLNPVPTTPDNSPQISSSVVAKFLSILRLIGLLK